MQNQTLDLIGNWEKTARTGCSEKYPSGIQFQKDGLYIARNDPSGKFIVWDMGTYRIVSPGKINISLANDAIVSYQFSVSVGVLTFKDAEGCEFSYRKAG